MPSFLTPSTPPGSPAANMRVATVRAPLGRSLVRAAQKALSTITEPLDPSGTAAVAAFLGSAVSATAALVGLKLAMAGHVAFYPALAWLSRNLGGALWAAAAGAGLMSDRRLPKFLAWSVIAEAALFYGWDRYHLAGSFHPWNLIIHAALGGLLALPAVLAWVRRRWGQGTA